MTTEDNTSGSGAGTEFEARDEALLALLDGAPLSQSLLQESDLGSLEILGALAASLPAVRPTAAHKARLFSSLGLAVPAAANVDQSGASVMAFPTVRPGTLGSSHDRTFDRADVAGGVEGGFRRRELFPRLALAAAVLLAVALGSWSGFLFSELRQSRALIAGLESELDSLVAVPAPNDYQQVVYENERLRSEIGLATHPKTRVCALSAQGAAQPEAQGALFMSPEEGRWMLTTSNLAKCELGRRYRLWFLSETGELLGGQLLEHVTGDHPVEVASGDLPQGVAAVMVTLEFPDKFGDRPAGDKVLFGDRSVEMY